MSRAHVFETYVLVSRTSSDQAVVLETTSTVVHVDDVRLPTVALRGVLRRVRVVVGRLERLQTSSVAVVGVHVDLRPSPYGVVLPCE